MFARGTHMRLLVLLFTSFLLLTGCGSSQTELQTDAKKVEITVSAAASLTDALQEIQKMYEKQHPDVKIYFNFGASGALQQQIEQGAPVDLFISASEQYMKKLMDKDIISEDQQTNLLTNDLTVITAVNKDINIQDAKDLLRTEVHKVAIGIPDSVPAGKYAEEALKHAGVWDELRPKMVQAKDVRQVLQYVETGNVDAGIVYKTDALSSDQVKIAYTVDSSSYSPIEYPMGIISSTANKQEVTDLYTYFQSKDALSIFMKYGFSVPDV